MTTFTLTGARFTEEGEYVATVSTATFKIVTTDDYLVKYSIIPPIELGDSSQVNLSPARGEDFFSRLNGNGFNPGLFSGASVAEVTWGGGKKTQLLLLDFGDAQDSYSIFRLDGAALPTFTTTAQANSFFNGVTKINGVFDGDFAAGKAIDLRDLAAFSRVTQNDVVIANGRYENWEGKVIRTGVGNDKVFAVSANDVIDLGSGNDTARGGSGNDTIRGGNGADTIGGESGRDSLVGGAGADTLDGGSGNDVLTGGTGNDLLIGNIGDDRFVFANGHGADRLTGFENDIDTLRFSSNLGNNTVAQALADATQSGKNVVFNFGDGDTLTIVNTTKALLADDIVIF